MAISWVNGYKSRAVGALPHTQRAEYSLLELASRGFVPQSAVNGAMLDGGLRDFSWQVLWADDQLTADADLEKKLTDVDGYVIFIHGWTGSRHIWEDLPSLVITRNPRLVALVIDHNGFGSTPFVKNIPEFNQCSPVAAMRAIERWLDILNLRRQPGERQLKTINFVGHSMGGAALFFLREERWNLGEQTRTAIAPALLLHDEMHRAFYTTLGIGIALVGRIRVLEPVDSVVSPSVLEVLAEGATPFVKEEHARIYAATPKAVTARTFAAMGLITEHPQPHTWELMRVVLGHRDRLVGLVPAMNLMQELDFRVEQVRVVMGTHYLFSLGDELRKFHEQNRSVILEDILNLHDKALQRQKTGSL